MIFLKMDTGGAGSRSIETSQSNNTSRSTNTSQSNNKCTTIVLSCIDFRIQDTVREYLSENGVDSSLELRDKYFYTTLPGASLGFNHKWSQTFIDILNITMTIQNIQKIIVIDHEDCRYYKNVYRNPLEGLASVAENESNLNPESRSCDSYACINDNCPEDLILKNRCCHIANFGKFKEYMYTNFPTIELLFVLITEDEFLEYR